MTDWQRVYELVSDERERNEAFRVDAIDRLSALRTDMHEDLSSINARLAVLETQRAGDGQTFRTVGWIATTLISIVALVVACL